jgi:hypothetical protein
MSNSNSSTSATDIITYIGVPLAVLGVLPILYNTATTLAALSKVKRRLRRSRLAGIARGDVINHIIEVELPRFTIAPLDREEQSSEYWTVYAHSSPIPGGSWTIFNWKMHTIGLKTQRIEYADQLRQPQADIGFEELLSYLLDLGAVPNPAGFRMLRTSGLWIPTGTPLLLSPDRHESVLSIAPLDDSDGNLSLSVRWSSQWRMRDKLSLPPYWIRINGPDSRQVELDKQEKSPEKDEATLFAESSKSRPETATSVDELDPKSKAEEDYASQKTIAELPTDSIRCHINMEGLVDAMPEFDSLSTYEHIETSHLEIRQSIDTSAGIWFASAATALAASSNTETVLWNYHIPPSTLAFSRKDTVPCGVLVLIDAVPETATPEWATVYNDEEERRELMFSRMRETSNQSMREQSMTPAQRALSQRERHDSFHQNFRDDIQKEARRKRERADARMLEALQSPRWDNKLVGEHMLTWLKAKGHVCESYNRERIAEVILYRMLKDSAFAAQLIGMLDMWKAWVENGGMRKADYLIIKEKQVDFAYASLLLAVIRDSVTAADGSVAMDLQESVRIWKRVRLG